MTIFDSIKNKNIDELVDWFDEYFTFDSALWWKWWDENYCKKCESEIGYVPAFNRELEFAYCELNKNCRFFKEMKDVPDNKQIIKMWLESENREECAEKTDKQKQREIVREIFEKIEGLSQHEWGCTDYVHLSQIAELKKKYIEE